MKYAEVLEKLKQGWWLERYRGLYGKPPRWQIQNPKALEWGVVYHQTGEKIIKLENVKEFKHFPATTYKWVMKDEV